MKYRASIKRLVQSWNANKQFIVPVLILTIAGLVGWQLITRSPEEKAVVIVAAGDIACNTHEATKRHCQQQATARLAQEQRPNALLPLGDLQYPDGSYQDFGRYFGSTWGQLKAVTRPAPGNHEYRTPGAEGYFDYFNGIGETDGPAGDRAKGYYSFDLARWHLIALNSNCSQVGGCDEGSQQLEWLKSDLERSPAKCVLAYWHHPPFTRSEFLDEGIDDKREYRAFWKVLVEHGADVALVGHAHHYERLVPLSSQGEPDEVGVRLFIVGTGGHSHRAKHIKPQAESYSRNSFGVLRLELKPDSYSWQFVSEPSRDYQDAGTTKCH